MPTNQSTSTRRAAQKLALIAAAAAAPCSAFAQDAAEAEVAPVSFEGDVQTAEDVPLMAQSDMAAAPVDEEPSRRYRPTPMAFELGAYFGGVSFSEKLALEDPDLINASATDDQRHLRLGPGAHLGLRAAFFPLSWVGLEAEGGYIPTSTAKDSVKAKLWTVRGHAILQLPTHRAVPFLALGAGLVSIKSDTLGEDQDVALTVGAGLKFAVTEHLSIRADFRENFTDGRRGKAGRYAEGLIGMSFTLGRTPYEPYTPPPDMDGDGVPDASDACPDVVGPAPQGCPPPPDADGDGIDDTRDACPAEPEDGGAPSATDGCPDKDKDRDGILEPADACPTEAGIAPSGCPDKDTDGDGVLNSVDKCIDKPETPNGFQDKDGCPDELPQQVAKFSGVIKGILFDSGKTTIKPTSHALLDEAAKVMAEYPDLRVLITGHTDNTGTREKNVELSQGRADSVKAYLVEKGIDTARIETRGAGPDEPVADNKTPAGRAENRRIEFKLK